MKAAVKIAAALLILVFAVWYGSNNSTSELSETMIIQGMAIDRSSDGFYTVTAEILNNLQNNPSGFQSSNESRAICFSAEGKTVSEAVRYIADKCGKQPLFAHNRVIILGQSVTQSRVSDALDFFERDFDTKPSMLVCAARGSSAAALLNADSGADTVKSEVLEGVLMSGKNNSRTPVVRVADAVNALTDEHTSLVLPAVSLVSQKKKNSIELNGCAVFDKENRFAFFLDKKEAEALVFMKNGVRKGSLESDFGDTGGVSFLTVSSKTKYRFSFEEGMAVIHLDVTLEADLNEISGLNFRPLDEKTLASARLAAQNTLKSSIDKCFLKLKSSGCDAADFEKRLALYDRTLYKRLISEEKITFSDFALEAAVDIKVHRVGDESFS